MYKSAVVCLTYSKFPSRLPNRANLLSTADWGGGSSYINLLGISGPGGGQWFPKTYAPHSWYKDEL